MSTTVFNSIPRMTHVTTVKSQSARLRSELDGQKHDYSLTVNYGMVLHRTLTLFIPNTSRI